VALDLATPALLFPAISLLLLAYTNRFLSLAALIRSLHERYREGRETVILGQIDNLRRRVNLIRLTQGLGVGSCFGCVFCMFLLFVGAPTLAQAVFVAALVLLMVSLALSLWEIQMSVGALDLQLQDLEEGEGRRLLRPRRHAKRHRRGR
jgi:hypothetical protein